MGPAKSTRSATAPEGAAVHARQRAAFAGLPASDHRLGPRARRALVVPDPVREFIRAFNDRDLDAFVAVLDPEVEIHASRGLRKGVEAARAWATREPGGVQQTIALERLYEDPGRAVALITRSWHWEEDGTLAREEEMAWSFELRGGRVLSWRSSEDRSEALRGGGFEHGIGAE